MMHSAITMFLLLSSLGLPPRLSRLHGPQEAPQHKPSFRLDPLQQPYGLRNDSQLEPRALLSSPAFMVPTRMRDGFDLVLQRPHAAAQIWMTRTIPVLNFAPSADSPGMAFQLRLGLVNSIRLSNPPKVPGTLRPGSRYADEVRCLSTLQICF